MASQTSEKTTTLLLYDNIKRLVGKRSLVINTENRFTVIGKLSEWQSR